jgi:hypothetical protein
MQTQSCDDKKNLDHNSSLEERKLKIPDKNFLFSITVDNLAGVRKALTIFLFMKGKGILQTITNNER